MMHGHEKSRSAIVAVKPTNKAERSAAEPVERRAEAEGNAGQQSTCRTRSWANVSQALERIRQAFAVRTRGGNRTRESCKYGSVRGAPSNRRPYRDRRDFIMLVGGAAAWPLAAQAQKPAGKLPTIGFLGPSTPSAGHWATAFVQRLHELGWIEGRNITVPV